MRYQWMIRIFGRNSGTVEAPTEEDALRRWLDEHGFDSVEDAAGEHDCQPYQITVVRLDR